MYFNTLFFEDLCRNGDTKEYMACNHCKFLGSKCSSDGNLYIIYNMMQNGNWHKINFR